MLFCECDLCTSFDRIFTNELQWWQKKGIEPNACHFQVSYRSGTPQLNAPESGPLPAFHFPQLGLSADVEPFRQWASSDLAIMRIPRAFTPSVHALHTCTDSAVKKKPRQIYSSIRLDSDHDKHVHHDQGTQRILRECSSPLLCRS